MIDRYVANAFFGEGIKKGVNLPIHWPADGRKRVAPMPAPMEAKTSDALQRRVAPAIFFLKIITLSVSSTPSSSFGFTFAETYL